MVPSEGQQGAPSSLAVHSASCTQSSVAMQTLSPPAATLGTTRPTLTTLWFAQTWLTAAILKAQSKPQTPSDAPCYDDQTPHPMAPQRCCGSVHHALTCPLAESQDNQSTSPSQSPTYPPLHPYQPARPEVPSAQVHQGQLAVVLSLARLRHPEDRKRPALKPHSQPQAGQPQAPSLLYRSPRTASKDSPCAARPPTPPQLRQLPPPPGAAPTHPQPRPCASYPSLRWPACFVDDERG